VSSAANSRRDGSRVTSGGAASRTPRILPAGTVLEGRYEIQRVAGRGGMSTVYAARDLRFGQVERLCAVKEMSDNEPDPGTRALSLVNFERESALLATITHPAVPKIYDYFADGGMIYLVLEFIDGDDLERALARRKSPFDEESIVDWAIQICDVLEMLHDFQPAPIIFRDLKPSNIMLRRNGKIALIDFGIARTFQSAQRGTMIGTEGYAPPEQYRGLADARGDIYALGATLHHLVTNSDPRHQTPFTFHERPIQSLNPSASETFSNIVSKMVAYHPDQRYQTVTEVRQALERLKRRQQHPPDDPQPIDLSLIPASPQTTVLRLPRQAEPDWDDEPRRSERRRPARRRVVRRRADQDMPGERIAWAVATGDEVRGTASYDGTSVYIGSYDRRLYCLSPDSGTVRWRFETGRGVVARPVALGDRVVVGSEDSAVYCLDARSGAMFWQHRTSMPVRSSCVIDRNRVIVGSDDGFVYCFDLDTGDTIWRQRTWGAVRSTPILRDDLVLVGADDGNLYALNRETGTSVWRRPAGGAIQSEPAGTNRVIVTTSRSGTVAAFDRSTGQRRWTYQATGPVISSPRIEQQVVVFGVADGALVGLSLDDGQPLWVQRYANQITSTPLLGTNTGYIGTVDGACVAFAIDSGELVWRYEIGGAIVSSPCLSGDVLVVGSTDHRVYGIALADWELQELRHEDGSN
jgi:outer membrane protein assembly factor BamB/serine/threonine protein kinase